MDAYKMIHNSERRMIALVVLACLAVVLTACSSSSAAPRTSGRSESVTPTSSYNRSQVDAILKAAMIPPRTWPGPTTSPPPAKNKRVFILAAIMASITKNNVQGIVEACHLLGWKTTVFDGQGEPSLWVDGLEQALTEHYNGVILSSITSTLVAPQIAALRKAGIPVVDVSNTVPPSPTGVDANVGYHPREEGKIMAAEIASLSKGHAKIAMLTDNEFGVVIERQVAFAAALASFCPGCDLVKTMQFTAAELGTPQLMTRVQALLKANPSINYVFVGYDDAATTVVQAVDSAGLRSKVRVVSISGEPQNLGYVRNGNVEVADLAIPNEWMGFEAVDTLDRLFDGVPSSALTKQITDSEPHLLLTKSNISQVPPGSYWSGSFNYVAQYKKIWGLG